MKLKDLLKLARARKIIIFHYETLEKISVIHENDLRNLNNKFNECKVCRFAVSGEEAFTLNVFVK